MKPARRSRKHREFGRIVALRAPGIAVAMSPRRNREAITVRGQPVIEIEQPIADAKHDVAAAEDAALRLVAGIIADRIEEMSRRQVEEANREQDRARQSA
jgi:hypothetical protein